MRDEGGVMPTRAKIKISDNAELRAKIDALYEQTAQAELAKWALLIAKRVLEMAGIDYRAIAEVTDGFRVNDLWQADGARMRDVRKAGFKVHQLARVCASEMERAALRTAGQAVGAGHMREHAMVAADYAIKSGWPPERRATWARSPRSGNGN